jgi:alpha-galactosidase
VVLASRRCSLPGGNNNDRLHAGNRFKSRLDESLVKSTADALVATGLAAKGYTYVNMDDTWATGRDNVTGALLASAVKFPNGIPSLVEYVHSKHLRFGIYTDVGHQTCGKCPGTWGREKLDADTFAAWKCDFVKSDSCFTSVSDPKVQPADGASCYHRYQMFAAALKASGRQIVHSIKGPCGRKPGTMNGVCSPADAGTIANLRRCAGDARDSWSSVMEIVEEAAQVVQFTRPGFFADMDILEIGNGGLTVVEEQTEMTLWCALKSPLLLGNDLTNMSASTLEIVGNTALLAVNQDPLAKAALRVSNTSRSQVWAGPLAHNESVLVLFNSGDRPQQVASTWQMLEASAPRCHDLSALDLWDGSTTEYSMASAAPSAQLQPHATKALRLACREP